MEKFLVFFGLIVYWIASSAAKKQREQPPDLQISNGEDEDAEADESPSFASSIEAAQHRALEVLQQWEKSQRPPSLEPAQAQPALRLPVETAGSAESRPLSVPGSSVGDRSRAALSQEREAPEAAPVPDEPDVWAGAAGAHAPTFDLNRRLNRLSPLARAIVYAEILGPPVSLRQQPGGEGVSGM